MREIISVVRNIGLMILEDRTLQYVRSVLYHLLRDPLLLLLHARRKTIMASMTDMNDVRA